MLIPSLNDPIIFLEHAAKSSLKFLEEHPPIYTGDRVSNLKFLTHSKFHIQRANNLISVLDPIKGSSIFEIGPGCCYFLYLCKHLRKCQISGVDLESQVLRVIRDTLKIQITEKPVNAFRKIEFKRKHDYIVSFLTMFNSGWGPSAHNFWLQDCKDNLNDNGKILIHFNKRTLHSEIKPIYEKIGTFIEECVVSIKKSDI